jgi:hypothetical protein
MNDEIKVIRNCKMKLNISFFPSLLCSQVVKEGAMHDLGRFLGPGGSFRRSNWCSPEKRERLAGARWSGGLPCCPQGLDQT